MHSTTDTTHAGFLPASITDRFNVEDHGPKLHLFCKKCGAGWSLRKPEKTRELTVGNTLHLLNHAASHK